MLFHMIILYILINVKFSNTNPGTAVFYNRHARADCWSDDDIVKLRARKSYEELMPHVNPEEIDAKRIKNVLRFFRSALYSINKNTEPRIYRMLQEAVGDTIGAHLRSEILPAVRFAYYAGYVPYRNARQIHDLLDDIKIYLNTQGQGWNKPKRTSQKWANLTVAKIMIGAGSIFDPCACLITRRDANSCIHFPVPKHDNAHEPTVVALPFKNGGLVNLVAPESNNALLKYYTTASRCILSNSPKQCRHSDFVNFNSELWHWMKRDVAPHLIDEKLYSAYGGILRIAAAVQNYGKGLSRRNLFYYDNPRVVSWNPWKHISQSCVYVNADWTPTVYVVVVLLTAFSLYLVLICYNYICGDASGCKCKSIAESPMTKNEPICETVGSVVTPSATNIPMQQSAVFYNDITIQQPLGNTNSTHISTSMGTSKKEKVYDMNEETEKLMDVIMSENEDSLVEEMSTSSSEESLMETERKKRCSSPPKLEASMSELTVSRTRAAAQAPLYSTSTMTHTLTGSSQGRRVSDSWTESESSSSRSASSTTSKSHRSRASRNLAWARRVISKSSLRNPPSRTELEFTSNTTSNSQK